MRSIAPHIVLAAVAAFSGYALAGYAHDLSRASLQAYGMEVQTIIGGPAVWTAFNIPQLQLMALIAPFILFASWRIRWVSEIAYILYMLALVVVFITWFITVAYFSAQPGILG